MKRTAQTVQDSAGRTLRDLRISVTDRCNMRCTYCMPATIFDANHPFLPAQELLTYEEIARLTRIFAGLGARKLRITGGEPLVRKELPKLVAQLAAIEGIDDLALTTNGLLLPHLAAPLRDAGLHRITVSLDALDNTVFQAINGRDIAVERVLAGIDAAEVAGFDTLKINVVVQRGINEDQILPLASHFRGSGHIVRFIEFMDVGNTNSWRLNRVVPAKDIVATIDHAHPLEALSRHHHSDVAQRYRYADGSGEIGIISSVTQPFCGDCSRARLSSKGELFTCLFASQGSDLRTALRSKATDAEIRALIEGIWSPRSDRYSEERTAHTPTDRSKVEMSYIGG
jgi:cyclic pyranopterin phosphate synthase